MKLSSALFCLICLSSTGCQLLPPQAVSDALDPDGDGAPWPEDCDSTDPSVYPDAPEICDGLDNDCDGDIDEDPTQWARFYLDEDGDGYGQNASWQESCQPPSGFSAVPGDCDDQAPGVNPGVEEICFDGRDTDCDGLAGDCALAGTLALGDLPVKLTGGTSGDLAGTALTSLGDVDADGFGDVAIGAPLESTEGEAAGAVYLVLGPLTGGMSLAQASAVARGAQQGGYVGVSLASTLGSEGDGDTALLVGAHLFGEEIAVGAAWLLDPADILEADTWSLAAEGAALLGQEPDEWLGWSVAPLGDPDEDGLPDLAAGAPTWLADDGGTGRVLLACSGAEEPASLTGLGADAGELGWSLAGGQDVDGDGIPDLLVGSPGASRAWFFRGTAGSCDLQDPIALVGPEGSAAGSAVALAGDVDNDGHVDLLIGAPELDENGTDSGGAYLLLQAPGGDEALQDMGTESLPGTVLLGDAAGDEAGGAVAAAGDVNGDGYDDILVGAARYNGEYQDMGAAYLVWGPVPSGECDLEDGGVTFLGEAPGDHAGTAVAAAGDVNGDGLGDLLIGANEQDAGGLSRGAVYLVYGGGW